MTDYTWPSTIIPQSSEWRLIANTASFVSPLNGTVRSVARGGDRWACSLVLPPLRGADRATLQAFLARLRGQAHRVLLGDHAYRKRGTSLVNPLVNGASQTGTSLVIDTGTANATVLAGDFISLSYRLHMVVADVTLNGSGAGTLTITPPLRSAPADNASVEVLAPMGRFVLADQTIGWTNEAGGLAGTVSRMTVELLEDIV